VSRQARTVGLIFLVCAAPIVFATLAWRFHWGTPASANYGELIAPRPLQGPAFKAPLRHIYVVDPLGNLMMRYPEDPDPGRVIKDLERLLKLSRIG
jgi:hypothetical protein